MGSRLSTIMKGKLRGRSARRREEASACVSADMDTAIEETRHSSDMQQCEPIVCLAPVKREPLGLDVVNTDVQSLIHRDSAVPTTLEDILEHEMEERNVQNNLGTLDYDQLCEDVLIPTEIGQDTPPIDDSRRLFPINSDEEMHPTSYLYRLMFEKYIPLLMLGEGSQLSMTIAVAFMRQSFDGIYSSTYQLNARPRHIEKIQQLVDHQRQTVRGAASRGATSTTLNPDDVSRITLTIDATNLEMALSKYPDTPTDLIWFPFPCKVGRTAYGLLRGTIGSAASVQRKKRMLDGDSSILI